MSVLRNPRHERFCGLVASGVNPTEAYISIGYSALGANQAASRLLARIDVRSRVSELQVATQQNTIERSALSRAWVLDSLMSVVQRCMQAEPATDAKGKQLGAYTFNAAGANRALELLGRELGMFIDKPVRPVWDGSLKSLTDEQLARITQDLEAAAFKDDPAGLEAWRRTGQITIEAKAEPADE